jgi:hypothetical protein
MDLFISPRSALRMMLLIIGLLLLANIAMIVAKLGFGHGHVFGLVKLFSFRAEANFPTVYSSLQLFASSVLLFLIGTKFRADQKRYLAWMILATIFLVMSVDEIVQLHERLHAPLHERYDLHGIFYFSWVIPAGIAVLLFSVSFAGFLLRLPRQTARKFLACGTTYVVGAIGFEMLGARHYELYGPDNLVYATLFTTEELLEMLAIAFFVHTLLDFLAAESKLINVRFFPSDHEAKTNSRIEENPSSARSQTSKFPIRGSNDQDHKLTSRQSTTK